MTAPARRTLARWKALFERADALGPEVFDAVLAELTAAVEAIERKRHAVRPVR